MKAIKSRDACKNSEAGNSMEIGQQQQRQYEHHIKASIVEGRPETTRMPEIVETSQQ